MHYNSTFDLFVPSNNNRIGEGSAYDAENKVRVLVLVRVLVRVRVRVLVRVLPRQRVLVMVVCMGV